MRIRVHDWRLKAALQRVLSVLPAGHRVNYLFQRLTGGLPLSEAGFDYGIGRSSTHLDAIKAFGARPIDRARFYEFGTGWDIHLPLMMWCHGVGHQTVVDIRPLYRPELSAGIATRLNARSAELDRVPGEVGATLDLATLESTFGIRYLAPCDATATGFPPRSVDVITSTETLEHIERPTIASILSECRRLLADDGIMSFTIDYRDHYSYFDDRVSCFNFLRYDDASFRRLNSALHYQNRLRHDDYLALFAGAGFEVVRDTPYPVTEAELTDLARVSLAEPYRSMPPERVAIREAHIVLRGATSEPSPAEEALSDPG